MDPATTKVVVNSNMVNKRNTQNLNKSIFNSKSVFDKAK